MGFLKVHQWTCSQNHTMSLNLLYNILCRISHLASGSCTTQSFYAWLHWQCQFLHNFNLTAFSLFRFWFYNCLMFNSSHCFYQIKQIFFSTSKNRYVISNCLRRMSEWKKKRKQRWNKGATSKLLLRKNGHNRLALPGRLLKFGELTVLPHWLTDVHCFS